MSWCASMQDYLELGVILLRKKLYTQSIKNLEKAKKAWKGPQEELAKVQTCRGLPCNGEHCAHRDAALRFVFPPPRFLA